ncbi:hypothetical protein, partial [Roseivivax lentus]|uniref:hypothetical protein n=1 Tax=Roseivivax lentus TaxID=633194 RepID=UPI001F21E08F
PKPAVRLPDSRSQTEADGKTSFKSDFFSNLLMGVGAAQDLLRRGFDTAAIMRAGGWKSVNVLVRYLEVAEQNVWELPGSPNLS